MKLKIFRKIKNICLFLAVPLTFSVCYATENCHAMQTNTQTITVELTPEEYENFKKFKKLDYNKLKKLLECSEQTESTKNTSNSQPITQSSINFPTQYDPWEEGKIKTQEMLETMDTINKALEIFKSRYVNSKTQSEEKAEIDQKKAEIDQEKAKIDQEKAEIGQKKAKIDQVKAEIDQEIKKLESESNLCQGYIDYFTQFKDRNNNKKLEPLCFKNNPLIDEIMAGEEEDLGFISYSKEKGLLMEPKFVECCREENFYKEVFDKLKTLGKQLKEKNNINTNNNNMTKEESTSAVLAMNEKNSKNVEEDVKENELKEKNNINTNNNNVTKEESTSAVLAMNEKNSKNVEEDVKENELKEKNVVKKKKKKTEEDDGCSPQ